MIDGFTAFTCSYPTPSRSATPGRQPSQNTSARAASSSARARPSSVRRSSTTLLLCDATSRKMSGNVRIGSCAGRLELQHVGAEIGEQLRRVRHRAPDAGVEDAHARRAGRAASSLRSRRRRAVARARRRRSRRARAARRRYSCRALGGREIDPARERDRQRRAEEPLGWSAGALGCRSSVSTPRVRRFSSPAASIGSRTRPAGQPDSEERGLDLVAPAASTSTLPSRRRSRPRRRALADGRPTLERVGAIHQRRTRAATGRSLVHVTEIQPSAQRYVLIGAPRPSALPVRGGMPIAA